MRTDDNAPERADIAVWSVPLIADCLGSAYRTCLRGNEQLARHFTDQHGRFWHSVVSDDKGKATEARAMLTTLAKMCRLAEDAIGAIDELVMDELIDVVAQRYRGSPAKTRSYNRILVDAASVLARTKLAA